MFINKILKLNTMKKLLLFVIVVGITVISCVQNENTLELRDKIDESLFYGTWYNTFKTGDDVLNQDDPDTTFYTFYENGKYLLQNELSIIGLPGDQGTWSYDGNILIFYPLNINQDSSIIDFSYKWENINYNQDTLFVNFIRKSNLDSLSVKPIKRYFIRVK